jgi:hypothetical protein
MRIALYLIVSGVLILNMVRYPGMYSGASRAMTIATVAVGVLGAGYFARRLVLRR